MLLARISRRCSDERIVPQGLAEGPFDPDAAAEEQEPTRSSAFDAPEKPVVGGKLKASTIAVIGEGLAAKLQPEQLPRGGGADASNDSDGLGLDTRSGCTKDTAYACGFSTVLLRFSGSGSLSYLCTSVVYISPAINPPPWRVQLFQIRLLPICARTF